MRAEIRIAEYWKRPSEIPANVTKGQLASLVLPADLTFDYAIPQTWLNHFRGELYERLCCQCVTAYPKGSIFGEVVNLTNGEVYSWI